MDTPLLDAALDYKDIGKIEGCVEKTLGPPKYTECRDSAEIHEAALAAAKAKGQPLLVIFGFDTCPSCADMDRVIFNPKSPMTNNHLVRYLSRPAINRIVLKNAPLKISVERINSRAQHGRDLAAMLGVVSKDAKTIASPTLLFIDPKTGKSYFDDRSRPDGYCDWGAELAAGLEGIGHVEAGTPFKPRERC